MSKIVTYHGSWVENPYSMLTENNNRMNTV